MKKFYKITLSSFALGLVLMGIGTAVQALEISSFSYMGDKYVDNNEFLTKSVEFKLPDNLAKIYDGDSFTNYELVKDESLSGDNAILDIQYSSRENVEVKPNFKDNYYLYNEYTDNFSKYPVNVIEFGLNVEIKEDKSEFDQFKELLNDFKEKKIYNYDNYYVEPELTLRVSSESYDRFTELPEGYDLYNYGSYTGEMKRRQEEASQMITESQYKEYTVEEEEDENEFYD
jgi:hypothetical protein